MSSPNPSSNSLIHYQVTWFCCVLRILSDVWTSGSVRFLCRGRGPGLSWWSSEGLTPAGRARSRPQRRWGSAAPPRWPGCRSATRPTRRKVTTPSRSPTASPPTPASSTCPDKVGSAPRRLRFNRLRSLKLCCFCSVHRRLRGVPATEVRI